MMGPARRRVRAPLPPDVVRPRRHPPAGDPGAPRHPGRGAQVCRALAIAGEDADSEAVLAALLDAQGDPR
jgi:hypothetical protein